MREPESELKPPPWRLISTRLLLAGGVEGGVMMSVRTPAVVSEMVGDYWSWMVGNMAGAGEDGVEVGTDVSCIIEALGN